MRVCYIVNQYPAVSHAFIRREIQELEKQSVDITRLSLRGWQSDLVDGSDLSERSKTFFIMRLSAWKLVCAFLTTLWRHPRGLLAALRMSFKLMRRSHRPWPYHLAYLLEATVAATQCALAGQVDHIHAHFGTNSAEVALLTHLLTRIPFSFTVHGPEEFDKPEYFALREKVRHAEFVCAISSYGRGQLYRWIDPQDWPKIEIVRCGLDDRFKQVPPATPPPPDRVVCIGRICEQKGQLLLLDAAARLARENVPIHIVFAGDGEMRAELEQRANLLGLRDRITITGWIGSEQVQQQLLGARALVLPSFAEGIPVVIMEAMALSRPVISTYVAGIPELVVNGETGWLVPTSAVDDLTAALRCCLESSDERLAEMGSKGRERVLRMHDITTECAKLVRLFNARSATRTGSPDAPLHLASYSVSVIPELDPAIAPPPPTGVTPSPT